MARAKQEKAVKKLCRHCCVSCVLIIIIAFFALFLLKELINNKEANVLDYVRYTIDNVSRATEIGDKYAMARANGEFLVVTISAKNLGEEKMDYYPYFEVESNGHIFKRTITTSPLLRENLEPFVGGKLGKGSSKEGIILFDLPKGSMDINLIVKSKETSDERLVVKVRS